MKSIIDQKDGCYFCGIENRPLDTHHLLCGRNRKKADAFGLTVRICRNCHTKIHNNYEYMEMCKRIGQKAFEKKYSHEKWMQEFGKNYL